LIGGQHPDGTVVSKQGIKMIISEQYAELVRPHPLQIYLASAIPLADLWNTIIDLWNTIMPSSWDATPPNH
jgi:hypothetical protein